MLSGKNVMGEPLVRRRELLEAKILTKLAEPVRYSPELKAGLSDLIDSVKQQGFEGLVAKRLDSKYEPGLRSGAWTKMRVNQGQEFVIGGYTVGGNVRRLDFRILRRSQSYMYCAHPERVPAWDKGKPAQADAKARGEDLPVQQSTGAERRTVGPRIDRGEDERLRLGKTGASRQFEFVEWTPDNHLRHSRFVGLRDDKRASDVRRE
jgi:hypothetical protein